MSFPQPLEADEGAFEPIAVMHVIDTLDPGGLERVAVNLANLLPRPRYAVHLCTTRREGPLAELVAPDVRRFGLGRRGRFDVLALRRLGLYMRHNRIAVVHAHGTALFVAALASLLAPGVRILWHDHFGRFGIERRPAWLYRLAVARIHGVIAVTQPLANWARRVLRVAPQRVWYLPNFASTPQLVAPAPALPGEPGHRIVCVANLRQEKDHPTLLAAMRLVIARAPRAHLLLVGGAGDSAYRRRLEKEIAQGSLAGRVSWLGSRSDIAAILKACDLGVLSSASEGLPLALIEYGLAGLPAVATRVGQCEEVLAEGRAGLLVPPSSPEKLAMAILSLLESPDLRRSLAARLAERVREHYGEERALEQVCKIYEAVLGREAASAARMRPGVLLVGNFLSGAGLARGVCEDLAEHLSRAGWRVATTSSRPGRLARLRDMLVTVWRERGSYEVAQVDVYSGNAFLWAELACAALRRAGKPYVLTLHGGNLPRFARRWPRRVRHLLASARFVTSPSAYLARELAALRRDILVLPNPIDIRRYPFGLRRHVSPALVWLRAFHGIYNPALAVDVAARLSSEFTELRLTMIGADKGGGSLEEARRRASAAGLAGRVTFQGATPKERVGDWLSRFDVFLNTSDVDNAPVTVLEAMACGLCVVSTGAGGMPDWVTDGRDALLVQPGDCEAMAQAVRRVLTDPALAHRLSSNARARAESHDWGRVLPIWEELLHQAAGLGSAAVSSSLPASASPPGQPAT